MTDSSSLKWLGKPAKCILHMTDFSDQSEPALAHALRLALANQADLHLFHVGRDTDEEWHEFPSIRKILQRWGVIAEGASRSDVTDLGIGIDKVIGVERDVASCVAGYCETHPIDLIVMTTAGRHGIASWLHPSTAERVAEKVSRISIPSLFVPADCKGCVSVDSGEVTMEHVLVPVDHQPDSGVAVERGLRAISVFGDESADLTLLHVGTESAFPTVQLPEGAWNVNRQVRQGNPATEILAAAQECKANLIIMVTEGEHGLIDVLRGTTTEQVLRQSPCPVLSVPE